MYRALVGLLLLASGCGRIGYDRLATCENGVVNEFCVRVQMSTTYGGAVRARWNTWIARDQPERPAWEQSGMPCEASTTPAFDDCVHAGGLVRVGIPGVSSCEGLKAFDELGAFDWQCVEGPTGVAFQSRGLREGVRVSALLDKDGGFRPNSLIIIRDHTPFASTPREVWWDNPVLPLPENGNEGDPVASLDVEGAIYVLVDTSTSNGYNLAADGITITTMPGATLGLGRFAPASCNVRNGETEPPAPPEDADPLFFRPCLIAAGDQAHLWIEGDYDLVTNLTWEMTFATGILLEHSHHSLLRYVTIQNGAYGVILYGTSASLVHDLRLANESRYGVIIGAGIGPAGPRASPATNNVLRQIWMSNIGRPENGYAGLLVESGSARTTVTELFVTGATPYGVLFFEDANDESVLSHVTVTGAEYGIAMNLSRNMVLASALVANAGDGIVLQDMTDTRLAGLVVAHSSSTGIYSFPGTAGTQFVDNVALGNNATDCMPNCDGVPIVASGISLASTFVGPVDGDATNETLAFPATSQLITDWVRFDNPFRAWSSDGGSLLDAAVTLPCHGTCRIFDHQIAATDTVLLDRSGDLLTPTPFEAGAPCPAGASGSRAISDAAGRQTFLVHALEVPFDGDGDEDGLCESGETCAFTANIGAYQGTHRRGDSCVFEPGSVTDVTMIGHQRNGA